MVSTKVNSYAKGLIEQEEDERESNISMYITELTFEVSNKVIKDHIARINPKPLRFTFVINREKYFQQTINDLTSQVNDEVYFDKEEIASQATKISNEKPFSISFSGYFLKDYGFIGSKKISESDEITKEWFPSILSCMKVNEEDSVAAEEKLTFLRGLVAFGFSKALTMEHVFIDATNMSKSLESVEYVLIEDKKIDVEDFMVFREENILGRKRKS